MNTLQVKNMNTLIHPLEANINQTKKQDFDWFSTFQIEFGVDFYQFTVTEKHTVENRTIVHDKSRHLIGLRFNK